MAKMVIMGVMAQPIMAVSLTFMDVAGKYAHILYRHSPEQMSSHLLKKNLIFGTG